MAEKYTCKCGHSVIDHGNSECCILEHCHGRSFCIKCDCAGYTRHQTLDDLIEANDASEHITAEDLQMVINTKE